MIARRGFPFSQITGFKRSNRFIPWMIIFPEPGVLVNAVTTAAMMLMAVPLLDELYINQEGQ